MKTMVTLTHEEAQSYFAKRWKEPFGIPDAVADYTAAKPYIGLDMNKFFQQKMLLIDLSAKVKDLGYDHLADELWGAVGVFDAVQDSAEGDGVFTAPEADEETGLFLDDFYNDVLEKILNADKKKEEK